MHVGSERIPGTCVSVTTVDRCCRSPLGSVPLREGEKDVWQDREGGKEGVFGGGGN